MDGILSEDGDGVLIRVKAVPGASRDQIAGPLGDRLKVRVAAPPEEGKANKAIGALLAKTLEVSKDRVQLVKGQTSAEKLWRVDHMTIDEAARSFGLKE